MDRRTTTAPHTGGGTVHIGDGAVDTGGGAVDGVGMGGIVGDKTPNWDWVR
jgi:hypothetical protein